MFEKGRLLNLLVCAVFGLSGGAVSHLLFTAERASAQQTSDTVKAKRFELIDEQGRVLAVFGQGISQPSGSAELVIGSAHDGAVLSASALRIMDGNKARVVVGRFGIRDRGGAYSAMYQLLVQDANEKPIHLLK